MFFNDRTYLHISKICKTNFSNLLTDLWRFGHVIITVDEYSYPICSKVLGDY